MTTLRRRLGREHEARRLADLLALWLPEALGRPLSRSAVRKIVMAGAVRIDGLPVRRPGRPLRRDESIEVRIRLDQVASPADQRPFAVGAQDILLEDRWLLAVAKPPALAFHPGADPARPSLVTSVLAFLAARQPPRGAEPPYLGVHQRLDRDTSGVALFTTSRDANPGLARALAERRVVKLYHALTRRPPRLPLRDFTVADQLGVVGRGRKARMGRVATEGAAAETSFRLLAAYAPGLLIEARPRTGRKHQIRAHLAGAGLAILGDERYGAGDEPTAPHAPRLMLHALRLELAHPVTGAPLTIECPYADDFRAMLERLRSAPARGSF